MKDEIKNVAGHKEGTVDLEKLARLVRYFILICTTGAGSGHPTSSLSAADLLVGLMFTGLFKYNAENPKHPNNDRLIFSKGHASPLLYSLWTAAGKISVQELMTYRQFGSTLEGHPTVTFRYAEAATGSLGQGLSIGSGMALNAKYVDKLPYRTYVLLGDSEMAEGSQWEAMQLAAHYRLNNLIGILDVNRLGQRGETMYGHDTGAYESRIASFGWETIVIDGHNFDEILPAYYKAVESRDKPVMIIARTIKGKGVSFVEDKNGWHGKALNKEQLDQALRDLGTVDTSLRGQIAKPEDLYPEKNSPGNAGPLGYDNGKPVATRKAYGNALKRIFPEFPDMVVLDGEVSNSTYSDEFKNAFPDLFFEMYIAEQNMVGSALGLVCRGKIPFVSTFAAFFTRAFDQIRMTQYSESNIKFCGSHAGVSIGQDGPSQMGLEDIAMFRSVLNCVVLYPSDAISTEKLVEEAALHKGMVYIRTTRENTPILYGAHESFPIGKSKTLRQSVNDSVTVIAAGVTVFEALAACEELAREGINIRVVDLYCIKPIDSEALKWTIMGTRAVITVEDHHEEGGIGEAVRSALAGEPTPIYSLAVRKMPKSGKPEELLDYEEISKNAIIKKVREVL
ncbi:MAG: transketolase [Dissulfurispiraceae bacterium]